MKRRKVVWRHPGHQKKKGKKKGPITPFLILPDEKLREPVSGKREEEKNSNLLGARTDALAVGREKGEKRSWGTYLVCFRCSPCSIQSR